MGSTAWTISGTVMTVDRPLLGVLLMIGFCALAPMGDSIAKLLGATIPLGQLLLVRFAVQAVILAPMTQWRGWSAHIKKMIALRTVLHIVGIGAMFLSLRYLPLADAIAIAFVMPFIMLLLGRSFLDEEVGPRRLTACAVGFCGTLLVIQPSFAEVGWPALLPLLVAVVFALFMLVTRKIAKDIDPIALQGISGAMATAALSTVMLLAPPTGYRPLSMVMPNTVEIWLLLAVGVIGTAAHLLMTWSLRFAPSATLAPMQYLEIPFATLIGWLVFSDLPNGLAALGIAITIGAGLYIVLHERTAARAVPPQA